MGMRAWAKVRTSSIFTVHKINKKKIASLMSIDEIIRGKEL